MNISDIKTELGLSADIDLSTAKIWLETTDAANGMIYAVDPITSDNLISITPPAPITVDNGTAYENMNLPETVEVETALNSSSDVVMTATAELYQRRKAGEDIVLVPKN